ncbi:MAG TPA: DUF1499 domain-containing protein [Gammaproteobacteria bacterium]|nr:DUF1499 domain-containing protein [Gammaproteobacteria bacterium]
MKMLVLTLSLLVIALGLIVAGRLGRFAGSRPPDLGVRDGKLKPPSPMRNSVSSQADYWRDVPQRRYAKIDPLRYDGDPAAAMPRLLAVLQKFEGATIVEARADYAYAQFTTRWLRFVDDVEFLLSPGEGVIHVRSASRLRHKDLGRNRRRVEAIRGEFDAR